MSEKTITTKTDLKKKLEQVRTSNPYDSAKLAYYIRKNAGNGKFVIKRDRADSGIKTAR